MTNKITSAKNPLIRHVKQLATSAKYRQEHQRTVLDGVHLCEAYLQAGLSPEGVVVSSESLKDQEVLKITSQLGEGIDVIEVPASLFERISSLENGVGLLFVIAIPDTSEANKLQGDALLLDAVQDPGNVGAMLRTAAAAGVKDVYLSPGSASVWSPKALRAGMGAHFGLNMYEKVELGSLINSSEVPVLATSLEAEHSLYDKNLTQPTAWLFGNEGAGVSSQLLELCEAVIIPQESSVESLNVAASAAVCLFEQRRQRVLQ